MTSTGHLPLWHRVLEEDGDEDAPDSLEAAVRDEIANLWSDLGTAMRMAYRGGWSAGCDNIAGRIIRLSRIAGPVSWQQVPIPLLLDGTWHRLLADAGIAHDEPGEDDLQRMRAWADSQRDAVLGLKGNASTAPVMSEPITFRFTAPDGEVFAPDAPLPVDNWHTLLADAERALTASFKSALVVEHSLTTPYRNDPRWSPWTRWAERPARNAHDTAMRIRKFLRDNPGGDGA